FDSEGAQLIGSQLRPLLHRDLRFQGGKGNRPVKGTGIEVAIAELVGDSLRRGALPRRCGTVDSNDDPATARGHVRPLPSFPTVSQKPGNETSTTSGASISSSTPGSAPSTPNAMAM